MIISKFTIKKTTLALVVVTLSFMFTYATGSAQTPTTDDSFNITTSPLPVLLDGKPGSNVSTKLRVQNSGTAATRFKVELKKFKAFGDQGKPILLDRQAGDEFFDWVSFSKTSFRAEPNVWNEITMNIKVPSNAAFGYYYAVIFSKDGPAPKNKDGSSSLAGAAAILVLLNVDAPGANKKLEVTSFSVSKKLYEYLPATFTIKVRNSGKVHLSPSGNVYITKGSKQIATLSINPTLSNVLPDSRRVYSIEWKDGFPVFEVKRDNGEIVVNKQGQPERQLNWDFAKADRLKFGKYTANMLLVYDDGNRDIPVEASVSFWVVPWKMLPVILLMVVLIGIGLWTSYRSLLKKVKKR